MGTARWWMGVYNVPASDSISNYVVVHFISVCALIGILLRSIGHDDSSSIVGRIRTIVGAVGGQAGRLASATKSVSSSGLLL